MSTYTSQHQKYTHVANKEEKKNKEERNEFSSKRKPVRKKKLHSTQDFVLENT